jgi:predicted alpha/beta superfamily hydrolase
MKIIILKNSYKNRLLLLFFLFLILFTNAQTTIILESIPQNTPSDDILYIAGYFNSWQPNATPFTKNDENQYIVVIPFSKNKIEYKITRGSWEAVETNEKGNGISNRVILPKQKAITIHVENWEDFFIKEKKSTATANVKVLNDSFFIPQLNRFRRISIYLPSDYLESKAGYPVIYMQDGQNVFDEATANFGEWQVDETLLRLEKERNFKAIVIAIDNGQDHRMAEYNPWIHKKYGGGEGDEYVDFIVHTLKPFIDKQYRTQPEAANTAIIGSSMGGLISIYAIMKYPNIFGKAGVFSPSFWISKNAYRQVQQKANPQQQKIYMIVGLEEAPIMAKSFKKMHRILKRKGFDNQNLKAIAIEDGKHQEWFWAREFEQAVLWLFEAQ